MPRPTLPRLPRRFPSPTGPIVRQSVRHPRLVLLLILVPCAAALFALAATQSLISEQTIFDFFVRADRHTRASAARAAARAAFPVPAPSSLGVPVERSRPAHGLSLALLVADAGDAARARGRDSIASGTHANLLQSPRALCVLAAAERAVLDTPGYDTLCFSDPPARECNASLAAAGAMQRACAAPISVLQARSLLGISTQPGELTRGAVRLDASTACTRRRHDAGAAAEPLPAANVSAFAAAVRAGESGLTDVAALMSAGAADRADPWAVVSSFVIGQPFTGFTGPEDRPTEQRAMYDDWMRRAARAVEDAVAKLAVGTERENAGPSLFVYLTSTRYASLVFTDVVGKDFRLVAPALIIVVLLLLLHTHSPLLSIAAVLQVFIAFAPAYVLYYFVLGQKYFSALHVFAVYLVLGIAVDDVFIFVDAWRQTSGRVTALLGDDRSPKADVAGFGDIETDGHVDVDMKAEMEEHDCQGSKQRESEDDRELQLHAERAYRRAVGGMAVTSITTAAAFAVTALSPIMPVSTFGSWACLLVLMQFLLVATAFPSVLVLWEKYFRHRVWAWKRWRILRWRGSRAASPDNVRDAPSDEGDRVEKVPDAVPADVDKSSNSEAVPAAPSSPQGANTAQKDCKLGPQGSDKGDEEGISVMVNRLHDDEAAVTVDPPRTTSFLEGSEQGVPRYVDDGDVRVENLGAVERLFHGAWTDKLYRFRYVLTVAAVALLALSIVFALRLEPMVESEMILPDNHPLIKAGTVLKKHLGGGKSDELVEVRLVWGITEVNRTGTSRFRPSDSGTPILHEQFDLKPASAQEHLLRTCRELRANAALSSSKREPHARVRCWIEDFLAWRTARNRPGFMSYETDLALLHEVVIFGTHFDQDRGQPYLKYLSEQDVMVSPDLRRIVATEIRVKSPVRSDAAPDEARAVMRAWEAEVARINARAPRSVRVAVASGGAVWPFRVAQDKFIRSLRVNVGAMLGVVLVFLTVATRHVVTGVVATGSLGGIVCGVLAVAQLVGWRLGTTESLITAVSIGYSFDGICHVSTSFARAARRAVAGNGDAARSVREALTAVGASITFGTGSTAASIAVLLAAQVVLVRKLAILVLVTMVLTVLWSLVLLPAVLLVVGPRGRSSGVKGEAVGQDGEGGAGRQWRWWPWSGKQNG